MYNRKLDVCFIIIHVTTGYDISDRSLIIIPGPADMPTHTHLCVRHAFLPRLTRAHTPPDSPTLTHSG